MRGMEHILLMLQGAHSRYEMYTIVFAVHDFLLDRELFQSRISNSSQAATSERVEHPVVLEDWERLAPGCLVAQWLAFRWPCQTPGLVQSHPGLWGTWVPTLHLSV